MNLIKLLVFMSCSFLWFGCHEVISVPEQKYNNPRYESDITVTSPSQGEDWEPGGTYTIKWVSAGNINKVNIIVIKKLQYHKLIVAEGVENNGSFEWAVPEDIVLSTRYQIGVEDNEYPGEFFYSEVFEIISR